MRHTYRDLMRRSVIGVVAATAVMLVGWVTPAGGQAVSSTDVRITNLAVPPDLARPDSFTLRFDIDNAGPADAAEVTLAIVIPGGTHLLQSYVGTTPCGSGMSGVVTCGLAEPLPAGATLSGAAQFVNISLPQGAMVDADLDLTVTASDANPANNHATITYTFTGSPPAPPRLDLALTDLTVEASPFDRSVATLAATVLDQGPDIADGFSITYDLPVGVIATTARLGLQPCAEQAGQHITCTYHAPSPYPSPRTYSPALIVLINIGISPGTDIAVRASVAPLGPRLGRPSPVDIDTTNNDGQVNWVAAADPVHTQPGVETADVSLTFQAAVASDSSVPVTVSTPASTLLVTWTLFSSGPASTTASATTVRIRLGPGLEPIDARIERGSEPCPFNADQRAFVCTLIPPLPPGQPWLVTVEVRVDPSGSGPAVLEAVASSALEDLDPADNRSVVSLNVGRQPVGPSLPATGRDTTPLQRSGLLVIAIGALAWAVAVAIRPAARVRTSSR